MSLYIVGIELLFAIERNTKKQAKEAFWQEVKTKNPELYKIRHLVDKYVSATVIDDK